MKVINRFRQIHLAPSLVADPSLHAAAKKIADTLVGGGSAKEDMKKKLKDPAEGLFQISCSPDDQVLPPDESMPNW